METGLAHQMNASPFVCFKRSHLSGNSSSILYLTVKKNALPFVISKTYEKFEVARLVFKYTIFTLPIPKMHLRCLSK